MRSTVLAPIEPVAPSKVTLRSPFAGAERADRVPRWSGFIGSPYQQTAARCLETAADNTDERGDRASGDKAVEAIHQASMPGNEAPGVLGAEPAFKKGFEQISTLRHD